MNYYADTDFFLAIIKESDWLKSRAEKIYERNKGNISTSLATILELLIIAKREGLDPEITMEAVLEISSVDELSKDRIFAAAHLIKHKNFNVFDAFHAVLAGEKMIISSDSIYDKIGLSRLRLEEK